jgi:tetratricopeptide (TPR) repeat protein/DNA-binding XRE family transcriptional regulator
MIDDNGGFGVRLRALRLAAGISQQELAERSGMSVRAISNLERGRTRWPYRHSLKRIADSLGLTGAQREAFIAVGCRPVAVADTPGDDPPAASVSAAPTGADVVGRAQHDSNPPPPMRPVVPCHLPAPVPGFVGRDDTLAELTRLLPPRGSVSVVAISGTAGVGKTALAVRWAWQSAESFPDGRLYVNLRGYDSGPPRSASDALAWLLRALGTDAARIPADEDERAAVYRSALVSRRVLLLLDNARDAAQVRPLLPGTPGSAVLVTSRDALAGLIARDGAARVELDLLPEDDAHNLLHNLIGKRAQAEPVAVSTLISQCCRLPLALRVAAELAVSRPDVALSELVAELADLRGRLDVLSAGGDSDTAVRAVLSWSYRQLAPADRRALRLISLHPGADFDLTAAAALTGADLPAARRTLERLARAYLVHVHGPKRFELHDLLRGFARELAEAQDEPGVRRGALAALFDHYLHTSAGAMNVLFPAEAGRRPRLGAPSTPVTPIEDVDAARRWLDAERANLTALVTLGAQGEPEASGSARTVRNSDRYLAARAIELASTIDRYLIFGQHRTEANSVHLSALKAARREGDRRAEAMALTHLGYIEKTLGRYGSSVAYQQQALAIFTELGDNMGRARVLHRLALVERNTGEFDAAQAHALEVIDLCRLAGERLGEAHASHAVGAVNIERGRYPQAAGFLHRTLELLDAARDRASRSVTVKELGVIEQRYGRLDAAAELFAQAQALCREAANVSGEAEVISQQSLTETLAGRPEEGAVLYKRAVAMNREIEDLDGEGWALARAARTELGLGRAQSAVELAEQALQIANIIGANSLRAYALDMLGFALTAGGHPDRARARHRAALDLAESMGAEHQRADAHHGLAQAHAALGLDEAALDHARAAYAWYAEAGVPEAAQIRARFPALVQSTDALMRRPGGEGTARVAMV